MELSVMVIARHHPNNAIGAITGDLGFGSAIEALNLWNRRNIPQSTADAMRQISGGNLMMALNRPQEGTGQPDNYMLIPNQPLGVMMGITQLMMPDGRYASSPQHGQDVMQYDHMIAHFSDVSFDGTHRSEKIQQQTKQLERLDVVILDGRGDEYSLRNAQQAARNMRQILCYKGAIVCLGDAIPAQPDADINAYVGNRQQGLQEELARAIRRVTPQTARYQERFKLELDRVKSDIITQATPVIDGLLQELERRESFWPQRIRIGHERNGLIPGLADIRQRLQASAPSLLEDILGSEELRDGLMLEGERSTRKDVADILGGRLEHKLKEIDKDALKRLERWDKKQNCPKTMTAEQRKEAADERAKSGLAEPGNGVENSQLNENAGRVDSKQRGRAQWMSVVATAKDFRDLGDPNPEGTIARLKREAGESDGPGDTGGRRSGR